MVCLIIRRLIKGEAYGLLYNRRLYYLRDLLGNLPDQIVVEYDWYYKITDTCVECGACARVCPNAAITRGKEKKAKEGKQKEA